MGSKDNATAAISALCAEYGAWAVRAHSSGAMLPMTAVALALSSSGTAAVQLMLPRWVESPTNSCGMSFAARMNCARSDSVNGRQLTINLRSFHIPMRFTL